MFTTSEAIKRADREARDHALPLGAPGRTVAPSDNDSLTIVNAASGIAA
jgi:hypothetical protein